MSDRRPIPPHPAVQLPGVHGYTDRKNVRAGDTVHFHLSSTHPYQLSVCRLGARVQDDAADEVLHRFPPSPPRPQPIHPGSYVFVPNGLPARHKMAALSMECWILPWRLDARQALLSQFDAPGGAGVGLFLGANGGLEVLLGDGTEVRRYEAGQLQGRRWQHVAACFDGAFVTLWIDGAVVGSWPRSELVLPGPAPLRLGAAAEGGVACCLLDADIAMPAIHARALTPEELAARVADRALRAPSGRDVLACWPLREERGDVVADVSGHQRTGRIINHATWMVNGPGFDMQKVGPYGQDGYDPMQDPTRGHGLRLASDDLVDCRWEVTHSFNLPADTRSGLYVGRVAFERDGIPLTYDITFTVAPARGASKAPALVLCAANTWLAYATTPFAANTHGAATWPRRAIGLANSHPDAPAYSSYTFHQHGQPSYYTGLRLPWPNASPYALYDPEGTGFSQWVRLERELHVWLDAAGYAYDVASDFDLHLEPDLLDGYRTVIIAGHSEYWSTPALDGLDRYLRAGGTAIVLSGNTMHSRVSFDEALGVMEQRKTAMPGKDIRIGRPGGPHGEQFHSQDWARGGLLRFADRPAVALVGLDTAGWGFANGDDFGHYQAVQPDHPLFHVPHEVGLGADGVFGQAPDGGLPRAIGHEWDLTLATLRRMTRVVPPNGRIPPEQEGIEVIAHGLRPRRGNLDAYLNWFDKVTPTLDGLSAEMIYWERPEGGRVFNAGAVAAAWVLPVDPCFDRLLRNVLHRFGVSPGPAPVPSPPSG